MRPSKYRTLLVLLLCTTVVGVGSGMAAVSLFGREPVSGDIPLRAAEGPTVTVSGASGLELTNFTADKETVVVSSDLGNATVSAAGDSDITLESITGWTNTSSINASTYDITIDPTDKPEASVGGDIKTFDYSDTVAVDDGTVDFTYSGTTGSSEVTLTGLSTSETVAAVDAQTGQYLDVATVSNGEVSFVLPNSAHSVVLQTSDGGPTLSDPSPTGSQSTPPSALTVNVSDVDFPADNVTVTATLDGTPIATKTANSAGELSFSINGGSLQAGTHTVTMDATDEFGQTDSISYTFQTPDTLYIRNETSPTELVKDNTTVSVTFFGQDNAVITRSTTTGKINLTGLPTNQALVVETEADGYYSRTIVIEELWQQETVYMLNESSDSVLVDFKLEDDTGQFVTEDTVVKIQKAITINGTTEYRTISGDYLSATGEVSTFLQRDQRYRIVAETDGQVRRLGSYTATTSTTETLTIGQVVLDGDVDEGYTFRAQTTNSSGQDYIRAVYRDVESATTSLDVTVIRVYENESESIIATRSVDQTLGTYSELIAIPNTTGDYRVEWTAVRGGETITGEARVGDLRDLDDQWPISTWVLEMLGMVFVVGVGGLFVMYDSSLSGIAMVATATLLTFIGVIQLPMWALATAAAAAILFQVASGSGVGA